MRSLDVACLALVLCAGPLGAQRSPAAATPRPTHPALEAYAALASAEISGERARELVSFMDRYFRLPGNTGFDASIQRVVAALESAGYVQEGRGAGGALTYRVERRPLEGPAWEPVSAALRLVGAPDPLLELGGNKNMVAVNSRSTPMGGVEAELVDVGEGRPDDFEGVDVRGKVVLARTSVRRLYAAAVRERGALGVLAYSIPELNRPAVNRDVISFSSIAPTADASGWGLLLSTNALERLEGALARGPVRVGVDVQTRLFPSEELTLVAEVVGDRVPDERFVFSAHVQEPGANDNASGVAALAEVARTLAAGTSSGTFTPGRTITMIWGDEISSTRRYLEEDAARTRGVRWGMSLDMVGEDTERTGGTFLIEKMPDPSAVWTRGEDRHTEWGGRPLGVDDLFPHYLNDFVGNRCLDRAEGRDWVVGTNPFEGGSDHVPFLRAGVPGLLLWHFTDVFYHTDGDRVDKVSPRTLENVSVCAAVSAMALADADTELVTFMVDEVLRAALARLGTERALSLEAVAAGAEPAEERRILETWTRWYVDAVDALRDAEVGGPSPSLLDDIDDAKERILQAGREAAGAVG